MTTEPSKGKRKGPPTFTHLPEQRAKKLKKAWVEKAKIKSQWKAEKRKEGLVVRPRNLPHENSETAALDDNAAGSRDSVMSRQSPPLSFGDVSNIEADIAHAPASTLRSEDASQPVARTTSGRGRVSSSHQDSAPRGRGATPARGRGRGVATTSTRGRGISSFRGQGGAASTRGRGQSHERGSHSRHQPPSDNSARSRSEVHAMRGGSKFGSESRDSYALGRRGQPDMRLRMNAMLDKIKRDLT